MRSGIDDLPYIGTRELWRPPGVERSDLTFFVLGHSFDYDTKVAKRFKELSLDSWMPSLASSYQLSISTTPGQRLLLCGRRSSGLSTLFRCLVNRTLESCSPGQRNAQSPNVIVLDLDTSMPEFSPAGTISLTHLQTPIFGPSLSHMLPIHGSLSRILKMHFLGEVETSDICDSQIECIFDLLNVEKRVRQELGNAVTVILAPKWLNDIDMATSGKLWAKLSPTRIVCLDHSSASAQLRPWRALAEAAECPIQHLPAQTSDRISLVREHELQMQSYFHFTPTGSDRIFWDGRPILAGPRSEMSLSYQGRHAEVVGIVLVSGYVALEDTYDALEGSIVGIVAVKAGSIGQSDGEARDAQNADSRRHEREDGTRYILPGVARTEEDLPRLMTGDEGFGLPALNSECLGLGLVTRIDIARRQIRLKAGGPLHEIQERMQGHDVVLVLPKATSDGRYRTEWARREIQKMGTE